MRKSICGWQYLKDPEVVQEQRTNEEIKQERSSRR